jgi:hypothetical protein
MGGTPTTQAASRKTARPARNKSLFASFSSEKEESLVLFLKKKNQKDFYVLRFACPEKHA